MNFHGNLHRNFSRFLFASVLTLAFLGGTPAKAASHHHGLTISTDGEGNATDCNQVKIDFSRGAVARDEQDFNLANMDASLRPGDNGGIIVRGWDGAGYQIKACKAAGSGSDSDAHNILGRISVSASGGNVTAHGPDGDDWVVFFIVQAPRNAVMQMETTNGSIGVRGVSGTINANSTNGPISLRDCSGQGSVKTENGPIEFTGQSGDFHLDAHNGPISVRLLGTQWQGAGLNAGTENGPLTLRMPDGYASGVSVKTAGNAPFSCRASVCGDVHGDWRNDAHDVTLGSGNTVVHLHAVNGPVSISSNDGRHHDHDAGNDVHDNDDDQDGL